jgi:hypothetical protein
MYVSEARFPFFGFLWERDFSLDVSADATGTGRPTFGPVNSTPEV